MKIAIGIPAYGGSIHVETVSSLLLEQTAAGLTGDTIEVFIVSGQSLITFARNQLVANFLASDCDRLVFVDADVSWEPGSVIRLAHREEELVGGAYRLKRSEEAYPVYWLDKKELWSNKNGLLEVKYLPGGFLSVAREVFETLREKFPGRSYEHGGQQFYGYFHAPWRDGVLFAEDSMFCQEWSEAGGKVWLDPELNLTHHESATAYKGHIGNWLKSKIREEVTV